MATAADVSKEMDDLQMIHLRDTWRSLRPDKRHGWSFQDCKEVAQAWLKQLPLNVLVDIERGTMVNLSLVRLTDSVTYSPKALDIEANYIWLLPLADRYPSTIPPGYFVTDCFHLLDKLLSCRLFLPSKLEDPEQPVFLSESLKEHKVNKANVEASKLGKCFGYLRYLFRESKSSHNVKINDLKSKLGPRCLHVL